jgi:tetratricopeptide (TPR) repeat protein/tRNA A-37 threonylcarbamoyl transferase component Bud32
VQNKAQDDDLVMSLVELALGRPPEDRESYLRGACGDDSRLFSEVWSYVQSEQRMQGFLLDPLYPSHSAEHRFQAGELLDGRFRIVREVAQGGMGIVYEARDEKLDRRIALKSAKAGFRKRLPPEVRNASDISHPNVCKIFEIHTASTPQGEIDFLTMEFLDGQTLSERLVSGPLPESEAQTVALQLCAGLAEAHRNRVIHGDLKSNNVILTSGAEGRIRAVITDFGLARRPESAQRTAQSGALGGTPDYMAPELWKGEKASVASDIYALGVILYELVSGHRPIAPEVSHEAPLEERFIRKPPPVDPKWDRVLGRCLDPDPSRRFRDADEVAQALTPRSRRWFQAAAAAVILAVGTGVVTYQRSTAPHETVRLAVLPFEADAATKSLSEGLLQDAGDRLSHVKTGRAKFTLIPLSDALHNNVDLPAKASTTLGATHTLSGVLRQENGRTTVRAYLTDVRSLIVLAEWPAEYEASELRNMPSALAGMVTSTLKLPPLALATTVNAAAYPAWAEGVSVARGDPKRIDRAMELLEVAAAADPNSPLTYARLAEAQLLKYKLTGEDQWLSRARKSLTSAEQRNPDVAAVRFVSGMINDSSGRYEQARADLQRAIEIEPTNGDFWRQLGDVYKDSNQPPEAVAAFRKAVELQPDYFKNHQHLGAFYFDRYDFAQAVSEYRSMVEVAPDQPDAHFELARPYLNMGRYAEAEHELRLAISLRETSNAVHTLAVSLAYQGQDLEAVPYYLRALELGPTAINKFLLYLNLGSSYRRTEQPMNAERAYRTARELAYAQLDRNPKDGYVRSCLAYLSARLGDRLGAESNAIQALELSPGDFTVPWMAALTYEVLGERERTLAVIQPAPDWLLSRLNKFRDLTDLQKDSRFQALIASHHIQ